MNSISDKLKLETNQPLNFIASVVTIINFIWTLIAFGAYEGIPSSAIPVGSVAIGIILASFLEALLAAAFGWAIVWIVSKGEGLPFLIAIVVMFVSAWTSLFNIQWLVIGQAPNSPDHLWALAGLGVFYCWFACYMIGGHIKNLKLKFSSVNEFVKSLNTDGGMYLWQIASFVLMFSLIWGSTDFG